MESYVFLLGSFSVAFVGYGAAKFLSESTGSLASDPRNPMQVPAVGADCVDALDLRCFANGRRVT